MSPFEKIQQTIRKHPVKWSVAGFVFITFPQWLSGTWALFCSTPLFQWLQSKGIKMPTFSLSWITVPTGFLFMAYIARQSYLHRKNHAHINLTNCVPDENKNDLEVESVPMGINPTKNFYYRQYRTFQIAIRNKNTVRNINNVNVELVLLKDELSDDPNAQNLRCSYPKLDNIKANFQTINPGDKVALKIFDITDAIGRPTDNPKKFEAKFEAENPQPSGYRIFLEKKPYPITFAISAEGVNRFESKFNFTVTMVNGFLQTHLTPLVALTKEEVRHKSEKAVEKLTEFSTVFFQRICSIKAIPAAQYDQNKDDELWNTNAAAIAYIRLNLNDAACKVYDDGQVEIDALPASGQTRSEDDKNVVLAKFNRRLLNLKRIVDDIENYIK